MTTEVSLKRFLEAQERTYPTALQELANGRKQSHWMWFIFPQVKGLGYSETSLYYGIKDRAEAAAFLQHPVLGKRLIESCTVLLGLGMTNATKIFGSPDDVKLRSSMTLFAALPGSDPVFQRVLDAFFHGAQDPKTLQILATQ